MKKKTLSVFAVMGVIIFSSLIPQTAMAEEGIMYNGHLIKPHPGLTVTHTPEGDGYIIDLSKYELHGNVIMIDDNTLDVISYQDDSIM
ncbi:hypothetical protein B9G54_04285 [Alloscardovia macacae]|uniref:Uncharacterized protein n=1 Tax=Alloscardovia macacae TaxID=1160091 RepID=A0A1Y2SUF6_9BIFI|nr:hypothetical protein [Alloscardovia macacae]OTA26608.1 hypothetical protein B9G54_04285 [Alloscardovia macacae]OTA29006.1 hypothetical protein B9T39_04915 [Alloscardovia macacae]